MRPIIAVDPGKTTGIAHLIDDGPPKYHELSFEETIDWLVEHPDPDTIYVVESYTIMPRAHNAPWSLEMIGAVKAFAHQTGTTVVMQRPQNAKAFADNPRLKRLGWYSTKDHARDALRHLVTYLAREDPARLPPEAP